MSSVTSQYGKNSGNNCLNCNFLQLKVAWLLCLIAQPPSGSNLPQMMKFPLKDNKLYVNMTKELSYLFGIGMLFEELHKRLEYEISLGDGYFEFL